MSLRRLLPGAELAGPAAPSASSMCPSDACSFLFRPLPTHTPAATTSTAPSCSAAGRRGPRTGPALSRWPPTCGASSSCCRPRHAAPLRRRMSWRADAAKPPCAQSVAAGHLVKPNQRVAGLLQAHATLNWEHCRGGSVDNGWPAVPPPTPPHVCWTVASPAADAACAAGCLLEQPSPPRVKSWAGRRCELGAEVGRLLPESIGAWRTEGGRSRSCTWWR